MYVIPIPPQVPETGRCPGCRHGNYTCGKLIPGIRERLEERTGINVRIVGNPLFAVIEGARVILPVVTALNQGR